MLLVIQWTVSAGILTFPVTYILASVLAEVYGYSWARRAAWISLALNALMAGLIQLSIVLPQPIWYDGTYFQAVVGNTWRIVLASLVAFTVGKFVNDKVFAHLKGDTADMKGFGFRAMASSIIGHIIDSTIFTLIAFAFIFEWRAVIEMIIISVCLKWGYEWIALPLTMYITRRVKAYEETGSIGDAIEA